MLCFTFGMEIGLNTTRKHDLKDCINIECILNCLCDLWLHKITWLSSPNDEVVYANSHKHGLNCKCH